MSFLKIDQQQIWYEEYGNKNGVAILLLHGGPGGKSKKDNLAMYDHTKYRLVQIDQRGCGNSLPLGTIENNTTQHLVNDIEAIRKELGIEQFIIAGSSWGSTLSLLYAETYPERVKALLVSSIFLARKQDKDWLFMPENSSRFFPDMWDKRISYLNERSITQEQANQHYLEMITTGNSEEKKSAVASFVEWEGNISNLETDFFTIDPEHIEQEDILATQVFLHYDCNDYFLKDGQIMSNLDKIKHIPIRILHGRYDMVSPVDQAYSLHKALPNSILEIANYDGHRLSKDTKRFLKYFYGELLAQLDR